MNRIMPALALAILLTAASGSASEWPESVLITNDDGLYEPSLLPLVESFAGICETVVVVVPMEERSSTSDCITVYRSYALEVEQLLLMDSIRVYRVDGNPGDCVLLALRGIMRDHPPDLVVSGINSGPNLGFDWLASGTIGAARIAAYWGVPAIAVSGYDVDVPGSIEAVAEWVTTFAQSETVQQLTNGRYLTVSFPKIDPENIKGVRVTDRAGILLDFGFTAEDTSFVPGESEIWWMEQPGLIEPSGTNNDAVLVDSGYIVVVPMIANEVDYDVFDAIGKVFEE
jgi:5'-nucleotidase